MVIMVALIATISMLIGGIIFLALLYSWLTRGRNVAQMPEQSQISEKEVEKRDDVVFNAFAQSYFEITIFGMITRIDNTLAELLRSCLTILSAEAVITALLNVSGLVNIIVVGLFLSSCSAFLISALILLWAISQRTSLPVDWHEDVSTIIERCREKLERLYRIKHRIQMVSIGLLCLGVVLLLISIIYAVALGF